MKKNIIHLISAVTFLFCFSGMLFADVKLGGELKAGSAFGIHDGDTYRNLLQGDLDIQKAFGNTELRLLVRGELDTMRPDDESAYIRKYETGQSRFYIREGYVNHTIMFDSGIDSINLKLGRLIYTWGVSDEMKPCDIINPQDYSNMFYTLIQDRKYGVLSFNASVYFTENLFLEVVAVPELNPSELATNRFTSAQQVAISAKDEDGTIERYMPESSLKNSAYAARFGFSFFDIDAHVNYYYGYDHLPVVETAGDFSDPFNPTFNFSTTYKKIQMAGFDFQRALVAGIAFRGEVAWFYSGKYFALSQAGGMTSPCLVNLNAGGTGMVEKQYIEYTIGFDDHDFFLKNLYFNLQYNQRVFIGSSKKLDDDQLRHMILFVLRYSFYNSKATFGTRGIYDASESSAMLNFEASYKFSDNFKLAIGAWIVEGESSSNLGQFDGNDIAYASGTVTF